MLNLLVLVAAVLLLALLYRRGSLVPILRWPFLVVDLLLALAAPGFDVALDNVALRQQLGVFKQKRPRPPLKRADRLFWAGHGWLRHAALEMVVIVKPETVVSWHRSGWRALWRCKSRQWIITQLREPFPFNTAPRYLIYDRDAKFRDRVTQAIKNMGIKPKLISYRSPWQNGVAETWVGSVRRELLNHVVVFGAAHMQHLLEDYVSYYHQDRCQLSLGKDAPETRPVQQRPSPTAKVIALPRVGGGHHRYEWLDDDRIAA